MSTPVRAGENSSGSLEEASLYRDRQGGIF